MGCSSWCINSDVDMKFHDFLHRDIFWQSSSLFGLDDRNNHSFFGLSFWSNASLVRTKGEKTHRISLSLSLSLFWWDDATPGLAGRLGEGIFFWPFSSWIQHMWINDVRGKQSRVKTVWERELHTQHQEGFDYTGLQETGFHAHAACFCDLLCKYKSIFCSHYQRVVQRETRLMFWALSTILLKGCWFARTFFEHGRCQDLCQNYHQKTEVFHLSGSLWRSESGATSCRGAQWTWNDGSWEVGALNRQLPLSLCHTQKSLKLKFAWCKICQFATFSTYIYIYIIIYIYIYGHAPMGTLFLNMPP